MTLEVPEGHRGSYMEPRAQLAEVPQGQNYSGEEHSHLHIRVLRFENTRISPTITVDQIGGPKSLSSGDHSDIKIAQVLSPE